MGAVWCKWWSGMWAMWYVDGRFAVCGCLGEGLGICGTL